MLNQDVWKKGIAAELLFWRGWLGGRGKLFEKDIILNKRLIPYIGDKKRVRIANIGSGPVCTIGNKLEDIDIEIISSDLLADEYKEILKQLNLNPICPVEKQDMAKMTYEDNSFDIVYCANALDHSKDPYNALKEMVRICKPKGFIYLYHIAHEGQRHRYHGLHQWNLDRTEDGDCIIWDSEPGPKTNAFLLSEIYPGFKTDLRVYTKAAFITSVVQKT
jgi:SAM-dependent methyltransferase